jgi:hypothetical protein
VALTVNAGIARFRQLSGYSRKHMLVASLSQADPKRPIYDCGYVAPHAYHLREAICGYDDGDNTLLHIGPSYSVSHSTISNLQA